VTDETELPLPGGWATEGVVRIGRTVRRPRGPNADFVERLLRHLQQISFGAAPRHLGVDEKGRDILEYVEGHVPTECGGIRWTDTQLASCMALLRRFHDATAGTELAGAGEVVCHGDFGPWNLVWIDDRSATIIDFDNAAPGQRLDDIGYALWKHLNLGLLPLDVHEQARRIHVAAIAYGVAETADVVDAIDHAQERMEDGLALISPSSHRDAALAQLGEERAWLRANTEELRRSDRR
jgi:aminoglycoside phosphotransferase (APT) family kinase protein